MFSLKIVSNLISRTKLHHTYMVYSHHDLQFVTELGVHFSVLYKLALVKLLCCKGLAIILLSDLVHASKGTLADLFDEVVLVPALPVPNTPIEIGTE